MNEEYEIAKNINRNIKLTELTVENFKTRINTEFGVESFKNIEDEILTLSSSYYKIK